MKTNTNILLLIAFACLGLTGVKAQTYHIDDKKALAKFLLKNSAEAGKMNGEQLGLDTTNIAVMKTPLGLAFDNTWVEKLQGVTWNTASPKRITEIKWKNRKLADSLNLDGCLSLTKLDCYENQLTSLDVTKNTALINLSCIMNQITSLDVSKNTALTELSCGFNQLTSLDVSKNTALTELSCGFNQLTSLDITQNTALGILYCSLNQLTSLDVSKNTALTELSCHFNQLTSLDVTKNTALKELGCYGNQLKFSTLPLPQGTYTTYSYAPQDTIKGGDKRITDLIDLSSEYTIAGNMTIYNWYEGSTQILSNKYINTNGKFLFTDASLTGKTLTCEMTNAKFPNLTLVYEVKISNGTGIAETDNGNLQVTLFPNPTTGELRMESGEWRTEPASSPKAIENIEIFDMMGRNVYLSTRPIVNPSTTTIDISHLPAGIYLVKIKTAEGEIIRKIVKE